MEMEPLRMRDCKIQLVERIESHGKHHHNAGSHDDPGSAAPLIGFHPQTAPQIGQEGQQHQTIQQHFDGEGHVQHARRIGAA